MADPLRFWKYEGLGNDFVVVADAVTPAVAKALCDRRLGVGADGVLVVSACAGGGATARVDVKNSDGSTAEVCGNGLRCVALHVCSGLAGERGRGATSFVIDTGAGPKRCTIVDHPLEGVAEVEVEMGAPALEGASSPTRRAERMIEAPVEVEGRRLAVTAVGMGNPHAVVFEPSRASEATVVTLGPLLEKHPLFPAGANAGFATVDGPNRLWLTVWERGAGLTGACGSGACAAAVAAVLTGRARAGEPVVVDQPGGRLAITVAEGLVQVLMRGPARRVFSGEVEQPLLV
jgi:diaminopimelate epimerase